MRTHWSPCLQDQYYFAENLVIPPPVLALSKWHLRQLKIICWRLEFAFAVLHWGHRRVWAPELGGCQIIDLIRKLFVACGIASKSLHNASLSSLRISCCLFTIACFFSAVHVSDNHFQAEDESLCRVHMMSQSADWMLACFLSTYFLFRCAGKCFQSIKHLKKYFCPAS